MLFPPSSPPPLAPAQAGEGEPSGESKPCLVRMAHAKTRRRKENGEPVCGTLGAEPRLFVTPLAPAPAGEGSQAEKASRTLFAWLRQRNKDARVIWRTGVLETDFVNHVEIRLNGRTMAPCTKRTECKPTEASISQISRQCTNADSITWMLGFGIQWSQLTKQRIDVRNPGILWVGSKLHR